jgi:hypothetical protein
MTRKSMTGTKLALLNRPKKIGGLLRNLGPVTDFLNH